MPLISVFVSDEIVTAKNISGLKWSKVIEYGLEIPKKNETITKLVVKLDDTLREIEKKEEKIRELIYGGKDERRQ